MIRRKRLFNKAEIDYRAKKLAQQKLRIHTNETKLDMPVVPIIKVSRDNETVFVSVYVEIPMNDVEMYTE